jgi:mRNA interferase MazF
MVKKLYIPDRQDIIWINLNPAKGHEQKNLRPVLVLSPKAYNKRTGLMIACAITSKVKGYPMEVILNGRKVSGAVLADQVRILDFMTRDISLVEKAPASVLKETQEKLVTLIEG